MIELTASWTSGLKEKKLRPSWDEYFLAFAITAATRSTCRSRAVGCVVVSPQNHILSTGYNGAPPGSPHCDDECAMRTSGERYDICKAIHAETNAIIAAARIGASLDGSTFYLTCSPCYLCARAIVAAGADRVVCLEAYAHGEDVDLFLNDAGVRIDYLTKNKAGWLQ